MTYDKSCPGSRTIREPIPESIDCPECGKEVEIWTDELKATCHSCGATVYRAQQASCIDWCPHAQECVGPEVYARLKTGMPEDVSDSDSSLAILEKEHERAQEILGLLRGAGLCLKMSLTKPETPLRERGLDHLNKVLGFFDEDLKLHFKREEEVLFPAVEKHIGEGKSPTQLLREEHRELWKQYDDLRDRISAIQSDDENPETTIDRVLDAGNEIERFLREHIKKEDESLFPLAKTLIPAEELDGIPERLKAVTIPAEDKPDRQKRPGEISGEPGIINSDKATPTELLKAEHHEVLGKLDLMEELLGKLEQKEEVSEPLKELAAFFETDFWLHFDKEERALFPEFDNFMPRGSGPLAAMMDEHEVLRKTNADLQQAIERYFNNTDYAEAIPEIRRYGSHFIESLRSHIQKEDGILFSMAEMHLNQRQNDNIIKLFNEMERGLTIR